MDLLTIFTEAINSSLNIFLAYWLFSAFFEKNAQIARNIIIFVTVDILHIIVLLLLKGTVIGYMSLYILTSLLSLIFKGKVVHKLTYTALFYGITSAIEMIVAVVVNRVFNVSFTDGKQGILLIIGMLLSKFIGFIIISIIKIKKQNKMLEIIKNNPISMLIFPASTFAIIIMQHAIFVYNPIENDIISIAVLVVYSLLIMANILVVQFIDTLYKNTINENRAIIAEELISQQAEQYKNILEHHKQISVLKHNHKNFCIGILNELKNGKIETAIEHITNEQLQSNGDFALPTDIINTIIIFKKNQASKYGVEIDYETHELQKLDISSVDLAVILGNALDNAIEATAQIHSENKRITVLIILKNNTILVTIKNPVQRNVDISHLTTTKDIPTQHGFGIISMKQLAQKYSGEVLLSCENNVFTTTILLHNFI